MAMGQNPGNREVPDNIEDLRMFLPVVLVDVDPSHRGLIGQILRVLDGFNPAKKPCWSLGNGIHHPISKVECTKTCEIPSNNPLFTLVYQLSSYIISHTIPIKAHTIPITSIESPPKTPSHPKNSKLSQKILKSMDSKNLKKMALEWPY